MFSKYYFIALVILTTITIFAQVHQNVYYLKNNGKFVSTKNEADFVRVVSDPDSGTTFYNVKEYYVKGPIKLIGKTSTIENVRLEGQCLIYYASGNKKQLATYENGRLRGIAIDYFPNGKMYRVINYAPVINDVNSLITSIKACNDSTGKALTVDGKGYYVGYDDEFKYISEEGPLVNGNREGDWKGCEIYKNNKTTFTEKYEGGLLVDGESKNNGVLAKYTVRQLMPEFKGGEAGFGKFLGDNIHYPKYDKDQNITGLVMIKFVVEKNGSLTDMEVFKSVSPGLDAEALRILKQSPKWIPGYYWGRPVRVQYTVPINFALAN